MADESLALYAKIMERLRKEDAAIDEIRRRVASGEVSAADVAPEIQAMRLETATVIADVKARRLT